MVHKLSMYASIYLAVLQISQKFKLCCRTSQDPPKPQLAQESYNWDDLNEHVSFLLFRSLDLFFFPSFHLFFSSFSSFLLFSSSSCCHESKLGTWVGLGSPHKLRGFGLKTFGSQLLHSLCPLETRSSLRCGSSSRGLPIQVGCQYLHVLGRMKKKRKNIKQYIIYTTNIKLSGIQPLLFYQKFGIDLKSNQISSGNTARQKKGPKHPNAKRMSLSSKLKKKACKKLAFLFGEGGRENNGVGGRRFERYGR